MFQNIYPVFEKKRLLKMEMLKNLRDYPRELFELFYQGYSNGIITGVNLSIADDYLLISPGILYWDEIPYFLSEEWKLSYEATEKPSYLKVKFLEKLQGAEKQEYLTEIYIDDRPVNQKRELELCRFKLQKGARLRAEYTDFFDYSTEFDTINRIHVSFASAGKGTIWPEILKTFARTLMGYPIKSSWDYAFCLNCLHLDRAMHFEELNRYLGLRLQEKQTDYENQEIFEALGRILHEAAETNWMPEKSRSSQKKMLLF